MQGTETVSRRDKGTTMTKFLNSTLAVTGAGGHLGRRVVELLLEAGATKVVAITRDPAKLADLATRGVDVRPGSFDDAASLKTAFAGVDRLLIVSTDTVGQRIDQHRRAIDAAEEAGVKHVAYTGLPSPYPDPTAIVANDHFWTEARLIGSKVNWSLLRNNLYADYQIPAAQHAIASGTLFHATSDGRRALVTREDCAAAAAGALLKAEGKRIFDISGPEALTADELAAVFADTSGKPVRAQNLSGSDLAGGLVKAGVPEGMAGVLARFDTDAAKGYLGIVSNHVEELTGRPPQSVAAFLAANRAALG